MKKLILKRTVIALAVSILGSLPLSGCSLSNASNGKDTSEGYSATEAQSQEQISKEQGQTNTDLNQPEGQEPSSAGGNSATQNQPNDGYPRGNRITEQTFDVMLRPLGQVTFAAYEPDTSENPLADVVFLIEKDGEVLMQLSGTSEDNVGLEQFDQVEAVSFLDYNNDGYDDIIIILSYYFGAGPQAATPHSMVRYYSGTADVGFIYEAQMSDHASSALAEITIQTARDFISGTKIDEASGDDTGTTENLTPWQQAYIKYLTNDSIIEAQKGYTIIKMSSDEIPQLVEVGTDEATGCRIVHYTNGKVHVDQLNRLFFSYIPGGDLLCNSEGNMDYYYDLVYRLMDGELVLIAEGYYGAEDNSRVQFDEDGNPIYLYEWNGVKMSAEEYQAELSKVYDLSKAVSYDYSNLYSIDEVKKAVAEYMN